MRYFGYWSPVYKDLTMILRILQNNDQTYENLMIIFLSYFLFIHFLLIIKYIVLIFIFINDCSIENRLNT